MSTILQITGLSKTYGPIVALSDLSLIVERGQILGVLGPNGSGKTTTLSIILSVISANEGSFQWFESENSSYAINAKIGALLETPNFFPYLTIEDNLAILAKVKNIIDIPSEIDRVLEFTQMLQRKKSAFNTLSFGMRQRVAIAACLLGNPEVLIFDEPTNGLDPQGIAEIRNLIQLLASDGKTIILASHILDEVEKLCTHVAILKRGKLITSGAMKDILGVDDQIHIACDNLNQCYEMLVRWGMYKTILKENNEIVITLPAKMTPKEVNEIAFKNGFVLSKFEIKRKKLEDLYLELIK